MIKKIISFLLLTFSLASAELKVEHINPIIKKFLQYHVEYNAITPNLVKRTVKIYIQQFDPEKCYLLDHEIEPYLNISTTDAYFIIEGMKKNDYSFFHKLNVLIQKSIERAKKNRSQLKNYLISNNIEENFNIERSSYFASNEQELTQRQKNFFVKFFQIQNSRVSLDTKEKREKAYILLEKKFKSSEKKYLSESFFEKNFSRSKNENMFVVNF